MSLTYGFYNSVNHDRVYNAIQLSSIFDGIIKDGVYQSIGEAFRVVPGQDNGTITVGSGRAWFNHTWTLNDSRLLIQTPASSAAYDRIDTVALEVNSGDEKRENSIKYILGSATNESPTPPKLTSNDIVHQYPLANVYRPAASTVISQANITNLVGTTQCPFVIGVLETLTIDMFVAQWSDQWNNWMSQKKVEADQELNSWIDENTLSFNNWWDGLKLILDGDIASNLARKIKELEDTINQLTTEGSITRDLEDSNNQVVFDHSGGSILGTVVYRQGA